MTFSKKKIAVIGAGNTGETIALLMSQKEYADIVLIDVPEKESQIKGKALDLLQLGAVNKLHGNITSSVHYSSLKDVDIVVVTAGIARKPNMSRDDLVNTNANIMKDIAYNIRHYAPNSMVIVLSNPVDIMTYLCLQITRFPKNKVIGQSGVLDTARFTTFIAQTLNVSVEDVNGFVLGGHGDDMVPLIRYSTAGGIPLQDLLPDEKLAEIVQRTRSGGGEIVRLLEDGSAYYAPAASVVTMIDAIVYDKRRILPSIAYLQGEFGYTDICLGVPTILGGNGIENVIGLPLTDEEQAALDTSVAKLEATLSKVKTMIN